MPIELIVPLKGTEPVAMRFGESHIITHADLNNHMARADNPMSHAFILAALECGFITKDAVKKNYPSIINHCVAVWKNSPDIQRIMTIAREGTQPAVMVGEETLLETTKKGPPNIPHLHRYGPWSLDTQKHYLYFLTTRKSVQNERHERVLAMLFQKPEQVVSAKGIYMAVTGERYRRGEQLIPRTIRELNKFMQGLNGNQPPIAVYEEGYMLMQT